MKTLLLYLLFILFISSSRLALPGSRGNLSLDQAVEQVTRDNRGRVISASTQRDRQQRSVHNIRLLTPKGKVKRYRINQQNGQYLRPESR
jgi:uncharacterized membrane protein YkoI